jgi:RND family efflux transporter MFP subunit
MMKTRTTQTHHAVGFFAATVAALLLVACAKPEVPTAPTPAVYVTPVRNDTAADSRTFSGTVRPRIESDVSFRVGGKVTARMIDIGQTVRAGQALAQLDPADYALGVSTAAEQLTMADVDAVQAASDAARFKRLLGDGSVGAADLERQQARADAAMARSSQARHQLALARNRAAYATLTAPFDGVVTALRLEAGQTVSEGQTVITIAKADELEVVVDVPESLAASLRTLKAAATVEGATEIAFNLKLRELSPSAATTTRTFRARYALQGPRNSTDFKNLRIGMTAQLRLTQTDAQISTQSTAELPLTAVLTTDGATTVWLADPHTGALARQAVKLLSQTTNTVRVAGLPDGALVVSVGAQKLDAKLKVRPVLRPLTKIATAG